MKPQFVTDGNGKKTAVLLPIKDYEKMLEELDDIEDMKLYEEAKKYESKPMAAEDAFRLLDSKCKKKK